MSPRPKKAPFRYSADRPARAIEALFEAGVTENVVLVSKTPKEKTFVPCA